MGKLTPHGRLIDLGGVVEGALEAVLRDVLQQHQDGLHLFVKLLVDLKCLLCQPMLNRLFGHSGTIKVVQLVDEHFDTAVVGLDGSEDEEVLQVGVVGERSGLQHNLLQQLDQLHMQLLGHEGLDSDADLLRVARLRQRGADLVNEGPAVWVTLIQHLQPQRSITTLHHIACLQLEHGVLGGALDEGIVARAALVSHASQVWIPPLRVLADHEGVVEGVGAEEVLGVVVGVDDDLAEGVVYVGVGGALSNQVLQERCEQLQAVARFDNLHQLVHGQQGPHRQQQVVDELVRGLCIQQRTHHLGGLAGGHLLHIALDVPQQVVVVQEGGQVLDHVKPVAHVDQRPGVGQLHLHQQVLDLLRGVHV
mmetsp:Transcript_18521/g.52004  ORF Transcript_18521/g.52004 Transcript_18521/m.52004 type:complete len:364 (-) Transcript_18521:2397-3488(-)